MGLVFGQGTKLPHMPCSVVKKKKPKPHRTSDLLSVEANCQKSSNDFTSLHPVTLHANTFSWFCFSGKLLSLSSHLLSECQVILLDSTQALFS